MRAQTCNSSTWDVVAGELGLVTSLGYLRPCLRRQNKEKVIKLDRNVETSKHKAISYLTTEQKKLTQHCNSHQLLERTVTIKQRNRMQQHHCLEYIITKSRSGKAKSTSSMSWNNQEAANGKLKLPKTMPKPGHIHRDSDQNQNVTSLGAKWIGPSRVGDRYWNNDTQYWWH